MSLRRAPFVVGAAIMAWGCHAIVGIEERGAGGAGATGGGGKTTSASAADTSTHTTVATTTDATTDTSTTSPTATTSGSPYEDAVLADGPLVYFRFEDQGTAAIDTVTQQVKGTVKSYDGATSIVGGAGAQQGVPGSKPALGKAIKLNGASNGLSGGYVVHHDAALVAFDGTQPFTIELWAMMSFASNGFGYLISNSKDTAMGSDGYWLVAGKDDSNDDDNAYASRAWIVNGSEVAFVGFNAGTAMHHYVFTYDGSRTALYVDANSDGCGSAECTINGSLGNTYSSVLVIGGSWNGNDDDTMNNFGFMSGVIDEVAVYDYALDVQKIGTHFVAAQ